MWVGCNLYLHIRWKCHAKTIQITTAIGSEVRDSTVQLSQMVRGLLTIKGTKPWCLPDRRTTLLQRHPAFYLGHFGEWTTWLDARDAVGYGTSSFLLWFSGFLLSCGGFDDNNYAHSAFRCHITQIHICNIYLCVDQSFDTVSRGPLQDNIGMPGHNDGHPVW